MSIDNRLKRIAEQALREANGRSEDNPYDEYTENLLRLWPLMAFIAFVAVLKNGASVEAFYRMMFGGH